MEVKIEDKSSVKKVVSVTIPAETVIEKLDQAYKDLKKNARVKGFRPGKAPRGVLERLYGDEVNSDVSQGLISESFGQVLQEHKLALVGTPKIDPSKLVANEPYSYEATIDLLPEIADIDWKGIKVTKKDYKPSDEEVDNQIQMLRKNMGQLEPVTEDRAAIKGDFVLIDYAGAGPDADNDQLQLTKDFTLELGSGKVLEGFDDQIAGMKAGETKEFQLQFPDDYFNKDLAGKEVTFSATLKEIRKQILPEVDDDLAKDLGQFETLDQLKDEIRKNLAEGYTRRSEQEVDEQLFEALLERVEFEVPETLVDHEIESMVSEYERALNYRNMKLEDTGQTQEELSEKYRDTAEKQVRRYLLLDRLVDQEKMEVGKEELEEALMAMAKGLGQPPEMVKKYYAEDPERMGMFQHTQLQKKALQFLRDQAETTLVEPGPEDLETEE